MKRVIPIAFFLALVCQPTMAVAKSDPIVGTWQVATKLVSASDPTNPAYTPGQRREETWKFQAQKKNMKLTTWSGWKKRKLIGSILGKKTGKAWVFEETYNTGWGILIHQYIVARVHTDGRLRGTIETGYHSAQFGYLVGKDALSFYGTKSR